MNKIKMLLVFLTLVLLATQMACSRINDVSPDTAESLPTPEPGKAVISGTILSSSTNEPSAGNPFLARNITAGNPDLPPTISFSMQNDPGASFDINTGNFHFENIEPGDNYVIILIYGPGNSQVIKDSNNQTPLLISVSENEYLDLGVLLVEE